MALATNLPQNPAEWTLEHARSVPARAFPGGAIDTEGAQATLAYLLGDHLQDGKAWIGAGRDSAGSWIASSYARFKTTLTPVPELFSILERRVNGACGNEADPSVAPREPAGPKDADGNRAPSPEQEAARAEWRRDVGTNWWTAEGVWGGKDLRDPTGVRGLVALASAWESGKACLRLFINPAARREVTVRVANPDGSVSTRTEKRVPRQQTRADALEHVKLSLPPPDRCCVYTDPDTHERTGVFLFRDFGDNECAEVWFSRETPSPRVTTSKRVTVLHLLRANADTEETVYPWGGRLPIVQGNVGCILTPAVRRLQQAADLGGTSTSRLLQAHGYGQRTEIGVQEDGFWSSEPPALPSGQVAETRINEETKQKEYFWPEPAEMQSDVIRQLKPEVWLSKQDDTGRTWSSFSPSVHFQNPSDPAVIIGGVDAFIIWMRAACHQAHIKTGLAQSSAEASGEAYEQARADFLQDIKGVAETVDAVVAELLTIATVMADYLTGETEPTFANDFSVSVQSHPSAGPPSTEWQNTTLQMVNGELISPDEGTARLGVQDVAAERARIKEARSLDRVTKIVAAASQAASAGLSVRQVLLEAGVDENDIQAWIQSDGPPNVEQ